MGEGGGLGTHAGMSTLMSDRFAITGAANSPGSETYSSGQGRVLRSQKRLRKPGRSTTRVREHT